MTHVKICGITNLNDALAAVTAGVDLLGFIFYEPSPRYVTPTVVKEIVSTLRSRNHKVICVGVFVDAPQETVSNILTLCDLDAVQLHGEESAQFLDSFAGRAFKVLRPTSLAEAEQRIEPYLPCEVDSHLPCFLLDAYHPNLYGGTGRVTDWSMAATIAQKHSIMLSGSLTVDNVAEAIELVKPWGVDVSSGVELEKGKKDHTKISDFIDAVKKIK
ncbi:MAG: phosphoribosylanthranilate isomerase [Chloroflexota bacterium]